MIRPLLLVMAFLAMPTAAAHAAAVPQVTVTRDGDRWTAEYRFGRKATAWTFLHSALAREDRKPWRPRSWTIETPGVRLERRGLYDVLVADGGGAVPDKVCVRFTPSTLDLEADYDPALVFTTGAVALFTDQFDVIPLESLAQADALPLDLEGTALRGEATQARFRDRRGKVLHAGVRKDVATTRNGRSYVLFGSARTVETRDIATIIDPALPAWIGGELATQTPRLLAHYASVLGPRTGPKPMLMATWAGPTAGVTSMGGSVLPGLVLMAFEGERIVASSDAGLSYVQWFVAHEAAHFWLGQAVEYDSAEHAWMMEGGADLVAVRALAEIDSSYDPKLRLNGAIATCVARAGGKPLNKANRRSEHDAYYACGAVWGLVAEAAVKKRRQGRGFAGFWRGLIEANAADRVVSQEEWLAELTRASGDPSLAADIRRMAEVGVADPDPMIRSLFDRAGVAYVSASGGTISLR